MQLKLLLSFSVMLAFCVIWVCCANAQVVQQLKEYDGRSLEIPPDKDKLFQSIENQKDQEISTDVKTVEGQIQSKNSSVNESKQKIGNTNKTSGEIVEDIMHNVSPIVDKMTRPGSGQDKTK
jgi:peptidoglycan hydrolase CwlO-like protein